MRKISYKKKGGVEKHIDTKTGVAVYMYLQEPGIYRNAFEGIVSEDLAKRAGFDVGRYGKAKTLRERMAQAKRIIEQELSIGVDASTLVAEKEGFTVVTGGIGGGVVKDPEGNTLTQGPIPLEQAVALLDALVAEGELIRHDQPEPTPSEVPDAPSEEEKVLAKSFAELEAKGK